MSKVSHNSGSQGTSTHRKLILSAFFMYCSMICKSDCVAILLVTTIIPKRSNQIKSTRTLDFTFLSNLFMLATCKELFFMNFELFSLLIGIITCFLDGPLVVIWIQGFTLGLPLTRLLIWSILFAPRNRKASLILMILEVLVPCFKTWAYDFWGCLDTLVSLMFLKYLEIWLTFFYDLVGIGGGIFSILARDSLSLTLLFLLGTNRTFRVNFADIFCLRVLEFLSALSESQLAW